MATSAEIKKKLEKVFDERQAAVLAEVFVDAYGELVKTSDFDGLKAVVKELAEAQARTSGSQILPSTCGVRASWFLHCSPARQSFAA